MPAAPSPVQGSLRNAGPGGSPMLRSTWGTSRLTGDDPQWEPLFEQVDEHLAEFGFHLTFVDDDPPFCYSVGFRGSWQHPELLLYGLNLDDSATVLSALADEVRRGRKFAHGDSDAEVLNRPVAFLAIPPDERFGRFVITIEYCGGDFEALQVVTSDAHGRFPWNRSCDPSVVRAQPLIGRPLPSFG
jgi:hypothetical protein